MLVYVSRDGGGNVNGVFGSLQPGFAEELLDDISADVLSYAGPNPARLRLIANAQAEFQDQMSLLARILRATAAVIKTEFNRHRKRQRDQDSAVANAGTLAALKTAWASVASGSPMPDLLLSDVQTAILNAINSTDSD